MTTEARERDVVHEVVHLEGLTPVYQRPPLADYLAQLWDRRHFIMADARGRVLSGSRGAVLGLGWLILRPVLDGLAYYVIFGLLIGTREGVDNFVGYLLVGVFLFQYSARALNSGSLSLINGRNMVKAFAFPRAGLPVAAVAREALTTVPTVLTMIVLVLLVPPREEITVLWLVFPVVVLIQTVFNLGLGLIGARVTAHVPDLQHVIPVLTRFWFYGSGVFFVFDQLPFLLERPVLMAALQANPLYVVLDMSRDLLLYAEAPTPTSWALLLGWTALVGIGGMVFFWRGEETYGSV